MNFINCSNVSASKLLCKTVIFWSKNSFEHINSLLRLTAGTTAVLNEYFKLELKAYYQKFSNYYEEFKKGDLPLSFYQGFLRTNMGFVGLLERIKFEAVSGYPVISQSVFHYIYEGRYINAVLGSKNTVGNVLVTNYFLPFLNNNLSCFYNQIYFWSIIAAMHPSLLLGNNTFYNSLNGYSKEFLTDSCNKFNDINFRLSSLKKPLKKGLLKEIFNDFCALNDEYSEFLKAVKQGNPKIFLSLNSARFTESFYKGLEHQINEHNLVKEINENIGKYLR